MTAPTPEQFKEQVAWSFNQTALTYDMMRFTRRAADRLIDMAGLRSGERVLDVATGTGHVALAAAPLVGPAGSVAGIDLAEELLDQARRKAGDAGLTNITFQAGDAEHLEFPDARFDVVLCCSAIFFIPNQLAAASEWLRVLRPGGRVLFTSFGERRDAISQLAGSHLQRFGKTPPPVQSGEALRSRPELCTDLLEAAGFVEVAVTTEQLGYYFAGVDEYWDELNQSMFGAIIRQLTAEQEAAFRHDLLTDAMQLATEAGLWRDLPVNFTTGRHRVPDLDRQ
ncbi:MAG: class I SAM-dependent methyltransferase [Dehalococcoidia bacterium]